MSISFKGVDMTQGLTERIGLRLSLAFLELTDIPHDVKFSYGNSVIELDLSHNQVSDLKFLTDLPNLQSLVVDHNEITSHVKIPVTRNLQILWVNHNKITNLGMFINTVVNSCPNLRILSMMNNEAAPSFFNGGTYEQYTDYRHFVISSLPRLEVLDYTNVTPEERIDARRVYPAVMVHNTKRRERNRKSRD